MDKPNERYLKQHQRIARGDPDPFDTSGFGVESFASMNGGGGNTSKRTLRDHERGAKPPIGGNQSNPDHGDH
jgi:hypothetical protein